MGSTRPPASRPLSFETTVADRAGAHIEEHRLENGMRVLLVERHGDPVVSVMLWYRVGSRNEREQEAGVSHFLEHMMFKGSSRFAKGDVDRWTTELGGSNNAFTGYDHTAYWFELAADRWEKALEIEADRMQGLLLEPAEFESERAVVLEELSMGDDDPWRALSEAVQAAAFERHPYRRPIIGFTDALKRLSASEMRDYHRRFYHPGNATLVISGEIRCAEALEIARGHFGSIAPGTPYAEADAFRPKAEPAVGERRLSLTWDDMGKRYCAAWPGTAVGTADDDVLDVIATLLTGGRLSRLYKRLVIDGALATSVSASNDSRVEGGLFWVFAECAAGAEPAALESAIDEELLRLSRSRVPAAELARVVKMLEATEAYDEETASDLAEMVGEYAVDAHWTLAFESIERIKRVTPAQIQECAKRLLGSSKRVVGWCLPEQSPKSRRHQARKAKSRAQARVKSSARARPKSGSRGAARKRVRA
ncbi:MAG: insulinase family protein [Planctomycetes bacterium]|nr:insulinase family protein [Planctomycetota bacterium]